jgi:hypothetical protein
LRREAAVTVSVSRAFGLPLDGFALLIVPLPLVWTVDLGRAEGRENCGVSDPLPPLAAPETSCNNSPTDSFIFSACAFNSSAAAALS